MLTVVVVPPLEPIPIKLPIAVAEPATVMAPMVLLKQFIVVLVPPLRRMPQEVPAAAFVTTIEFLPEPVPMVLPATVPIFMLPFTPFIPANAGDPVLVLVKLMFWIVLPCTEVAAPLPTDKSMPQNSAVVVLVMV